MMNDAMRATVDMMATTLKARGAGLTMHTRDFPSWTNVSVDQTYEGHVVQTATVTVYQSGSWQVTCDNCGIFARVAPELEARRFRRAA